MRGTYTPPDDLQPAIDRLTPAGKNYLDWLTQGREVTSEDIAAAADYERGENGKSEA